MEEEQKIDIPDGYELTIDGKPVRCTTATIRKKWNIEEAKNGDLIVAENYMEGDRFAFIFKRMLPIQEDYLNLETVPSVAYYLMFDYVGCIITNSSLSPKDMEGFSLHLASEAEKQDFYNKLEEKL